jgi:rod shape-determining protein MreC
MENIFSRHRNATFLVVVLFIQVVGLAVQVKRSTDTESSRLIRVWAVHLVTPLEKALVRVQHSLGGVWTNYVYLRGVRAENRALKEELDRIRLEQVRLNEDAAQARRLQALLAFREEFISQTLPAQVIGSSGSEQSRAIYIDKGEKDGIKPDMAVITPTGVVGKVLRVFGTTSLVLLISDQTSGMGAILEGSRLQGIVRGTASGDIVLEKVMSDEPVKAGERVLTSGGDHVFPKGMPVGTVVQVNRGSDSFWSIRLKPSADLNRLEEVLVITKLDSRQAAGVETAGAVRAVDILSARLPGVPEKKPEETGKTGTGAAAGGTTAAANGAQPAAPAGASGKPVGTPTPGAPSAATQNSAPATKPRTTAAPQAQPGAGPGTLVPVTTVNPATSTPKAPAKPPSNDKPMAEKPAAEKPPATVKPAEPPAQDDPQ